MPDRINKEAFIANILECFTLLQTYEECYKEILDIIDVINGLNDTDLTVANLQKLVEGSEYISLDLNQAGTKLIINLDRTHVDEIVKEDSPNLVTSGAVFDAVSNANGNVLRLPINVPTEPLVVMVGTNNAQTNVPLGDGLAIVNNHLVATGGGGGGVSKEYVDTQINQVNTNVTNLSYDIEILSRDVSNKVNTIDGVAQRGFTIEPKPNEKTSQLLINDAIGLGLQIAQDENGGFIDYDASGNIIASESFMDKLKTEGSYTPITNTNLTTKKYVDDVLSNKLDKLTTTSGSYAYVRNGTRDDKIGINSLVGKDEIVRRTSTGQIKANAPIKDNDCTTKKYVDDAISGISKVVKVTQAAYDILVSKDANTLYVIVG